MAALDFLYFAVERFDIVVETIERVMVDRDVTAMIEIPYRPKSLNDDRIAQTTIANGSSDEANAISSA